MNILIFGEQGNRSIHISVDLTEVHEAVEILEKLGYTITYKEPVGVHARFKGMKSQCLTILRKMIERT